MLLDSQFICMDGTTLRTANLFKFRQGNCKTVGNLFKCNLLFLFVSNFEDKFEMEMLLVMQLTISKLQCQGSGEFHAFRVGLILPNDMTSLKLYMIHV